MQSDRWWHAFRRILVAWLAAVVTAHFAAPAIGIAEGFPYNSVLDWLLLGLVAGTTLIAAVGYILLGALYYALRLGLRKVLPRASHFTISSSTGLLMTALLILYLFSSGSPRWYQSLYLVVGMLPFGIVAGLSTAPQRGEP